MRLLLDTHALFWWLRNDPLLSAAANGAIGDEGSTIFVSAISALEIAAKVRIGKWPEAAQISKDLEGIIAREGFCPLDLTLEHAKLAGTIQSPHRDPFDRIIAAQAIVDQLTVVTCDAQIAGLGALTLW